MIEDLKGIKKEIISITILCCMIPMVAYAAPYRPAFIEDLSTVERLDESLSLGDKVIDLSISYQTSNGQIPSALYKSHSPENIKGWIQHSWPVFKSFLAQYERQQSHLSGCRCEDIRQSWLLHREHQSPQNGHRQAVKHLPASRTNIGNRPHKDTFPDLPTDAARRRRWPLFHPVGRNPDEYVGHQFRGFHLGK